MYVCIYIYIYNIHFKRFNCCLNILNILITCLNNNLIIF